MKYGLVFFYVVHVLSEVPGMGSLHYCFAFVFLTLFFYVYDSLQIQFNWGYAIGRNGIGRDGIGRNDIERNSIGRNDIGRNGIRTRWHWTKWRWTK